MRWPCTANRHNINSTHILFLTPPTHHTIVSSEEPIPYLNQRNYLSQHHTNSNSINSRTQSPTTINPYTMSSRASSPGPDPNPEMQQAIVDAIVSLTKAEAEKNSISLAEGWAKVVQGVRDAIPIVSKRLLEMGMYTIKSISPPPPQTEEEQQQDDIDMPLGGPAQSQKTSTLRLAFPKPQRPKKSVQPTKRP